MNKRIFNEIALEKSKHRARPTFYNGVEYRSRLEAQWARWFHILKIIAEYEPRDAWYEGKRYYDRRSRRWKTSGGRWGAFRGWLPDFKLRNIVGPGVHLYVEVKPYWGLDIPEQTLKRLENSEAPPPYAIVGISPWEMGKRIQVGPQGPVYGTSGLIKFSSDHPWQPFAFVHITDSWGTYWRVIIPEKDGIVCHESVNEAIKNGDRLDQRRGKMTAAWLDDAPPGWDAWILCEKVNW